MKKRVKLVIGAVLGCIVIGVSAVGIQNQFHSSYELLDETDQYILDEVNKYVKHKKTEDVWEDFNLGDKTLLALKDSFGKAYLINPRKKVNSLLAKKIEMPSDYQIEVYRISAIEPGLLKFRMDGNFNTDGKNYTLYGNDVYYTKYDDTKSVIAPYSSGHYITFLAHEAFHYYIQEEWMRGSTYSTEGMSSEDRELLYQEYDVLEEIHKALLAGEKNRDVYLKYAKEYTAIVQERMQKNPEYVKKETERETIEGTATYVGIKASEIVGYDFGVMYFDNVKDVPFSDLKRAIEADTYDIANLADRIPYETGALLCQLIEQLEIPNWQAEMNRQTAENPVTLYSVIEKFVENQ